MRKAHKDSFKNCELYLQKKRKRDQEVATSSKKQETAKLRLNLLTMELEELREQKEIALKILSSGQDTLYEATQAKVLKRSCVIAAKELIEKGTCDLNAAEKKIQDKEEDISNHKKTT